ncbi:hypothetical protein C6P40_004357 [Pichia californica]|uniref:Uncharacterized protein n=1 Tax=Pichia californica TaxID=460514 RepID=A0A9P7BHS7_9ASCO|nr:hypothetical protein C6P42_001414 [[Candida] californica]KAG0689838.1 hypothetical protein C6P40_004357 [[Candida] californica]
MPDLVDKVFDFTNRFVQGTNSVLLDGYSASKDAFQQGYDVSKSIGGNVINGAKVVCGKVQENVPTTLSSISTLGLSYSSSQPKPPHITNLTVSGLIYAKMSGFVSHNITKIGLGLSIPTVGYASYKLYRYFIPYQRYAERLHNRVRYEVILVIGSINSTFVSKLVSDLNMRGYVVFVTVSDEEELKVVEGINDPDVKPLFIDFTNNSSVKNSLLKLGQFLDTKIEHLNDETYYNFKGVLAIPDYSKLPKIKKLDELSSREYIRLTETFFLKFNTMLHNGVLSFISESNLRREIVENYNNQKVKGGFAKLLFINFMVIPGNDNRRLIHNLSFSINKVFYDLLYTTNGTSIKETIFRIFGKCKDSSLIDMTSLNIVLHKNGSSTLVGPLSTTNLTSYFNKKMTPKDIHYKIFDLLNQEYLMKSYSMEG